MAHTLKANTLRVPLWEKCALIRARPFRIGSQYAKFTLSPIKRLLTDYHRREPSNQLRAGQHNMPRMMIPRRLLKSESCPKMNRENESTSFLNKTLDARWNRVDKSKTRTVYTMIRSIRSWRSMNSRTWSMTRVRVLGEGRIDERREDVLRRSDGDRSPVPFGIAERARWERRQAATAHRQSSFPSFFFFFPPF